MNTFKKRKAPSRKQQRAVIRVGVPIKPIKADPKKVKKIKETAKANKIKVISSELPEKLLKLDKNTSILSSLSPQWYNAYVKCYQYMLTSAISRSSR